MTTTTTTAKTTRNFWEGTLWNGKEEMPALAVFHLYTIRFTRLCFFSRRFFLVAASEQPLRRSRVHCERSWVIWFGMEIIWLIHSQFKMCRDASFQHVNTEQKAKEWMKQKSTPKLKKNWKQSLLSLLSLSRSPFRSSALRVCMCMNSESLPIAYEIKFEIVSCTNTDESKTFFLLWNLWGQHGKYVCSIGGCFVFFLSFFCFLYLFIHFFCFSDCVILISQTTLFTLSLAPFFPLFLFSILYFRCCVAVVFKRKFQNPCPNFWLKSLYRTFLHFASAAGICFTLLRMKK